MFHYNSMQEALPVFKALSAEIRVRIMELLYEGGDKSLNDIARALKLSNSAISMHMSKLKAAELIEIRTISGKRGSMKVCKPKDTALFVELSPEEVKEQCYTHEIEVGQYTAHSAEATCGLATTRHVIGEYDAPRYFSFPDRFNAQILWLTNGFVEYSLPNSLQAGEKLTEITIYMELSSEAPGVRDVYPSDIYFSINGVELGYWISPGDYGSRRGRFNPNWWLDGKNQYGLLKVLTVNRKGTFLDRGAQISPATVDDLSISHNSPINFRIASPAETRNPGGLTIFGKGFGDYNQGIKVSLFYE